MTKPLKNKKIAGLILVVIGILSATVAWGADVQLPGISVDITNKQGNQEVATGLKILLALTILSLAPAIMVVMTSFTRIIIVLSILRHALGMQQTPPNTVLISLALFLTLFSMSPIIMEINEHAFKPYMQGKMESVKAMERSMQPLRMFMIKQTREKDIKLMVELTKKPPPEKLEDISNIVLIPAFMLSELKTAFEIGFIIFLPFLLIDIVVASILMSMGMLMVPPMMISLPIKILMFVTIDGWNLVVESIMGSFT